jgi:hypothetical protein
LDEDLIDSLDIQPAIRAVSYGFAMPELKVRTDLVQLDGWCAHFNTWQDSGLEVCEAMFSPILR